MLNRNRTYRVQPIATAEELADVLIQYVHTGCTAFSLGDMIWANDSTSPDGAAEFAVIRNGRQIESITVGWTTKDKLLGYINDLSAGEGSDMGPVALRTDHPAGSCPLCA